MLFLSKCYRSARGSATGMILEHDVKLHRETATQIRRTAMKNLLGKSIHLLLVVIALGPITAQAYVGPGLGAGAVATVLGILAGILMLVVGIVWYPIKKLYKWLRRLGN